MTRGSSAEIEAYSPGWQTIPGSESVCVKEAAEPDRTSYKFRVTKGVGRRFLSTKKIVDQRCMCFLN